MCLYVDEERTKRVLRTLREHGGKATMWKVVIASITKDEYYSVLYNGRYRKGATVVSNRFNKEFNVLEGVFDQIERGIHVFTNRPAAKKYLSKMEKGPQFKSCFLTIIPVVVSEEDFVAAGENYEAVFMKVLVK